MIIPVKYPVQPKREQLRPLSSAEIVSNRASGLYLAQRTDEALNLAHLAVRMEKSKITLNNLAVILETFGRADEAFPYTREAYELDPTDQRMARLYGEASLRRGDLARGWSLYDQSHDRLDWLESTVPEWKGDSLVGRRLLVFAFGGYGDQIYFMRWLRELHMPKANLTYLCPPNLAPLARTMGINVVENYNGNFELDARPYDYHTMLHALPWRLGVTYENYRWSGPYLHVTPRPWFHLAKRVGFCWQAGEIVSPRRTRSLNLEQRERITSRFRSHIDLSDMRGSWLTTARMVASLDLLITVDTGIAHLGGALGIPTWVILPGASAWHYPVHFDRHPFYPTLRMFHDRSEGMDRAVDMLLEAL